MNSHFGSFQTRGILSNLDGDVFKGLDTGDIYMTIVSTSHPSGKVAGKVRKKLKDD